MAHVMQAPITIVHGEKIYKTPQEPADTEQIPITIPNGMTILLTQEEINRVPARTQRSTTQPQPRARTPVKKRTERLNPTSKCIVCNRNFTQVSLDFVPRSYLKHHNIDQTSTDRVISCFSCSH